MFLAKSVDLKPTSEVSQARWIGIPEDDVIKTAVGPFLSGRRSITAYCCLEVFAAITRLDAPMAHLLFTNALRNRAPPRFPTKTPQTFVKV